MFMQSSYTPEFAAAVFRAADSAMKGITPFSTYFVILMGLIQIYNKKRKIVTLPNALSLMVPYTIGFIVLWLLIVLAFYVIGIPLGLHTGVML